MAVKLSASQKASFRAFFWPTVLLGSALVTALVSSLARRDGQFYASAFLALLSLVLAAISSVALIPRLLVRIRLDLLNQIRFFRITKRGLTFVVVVMIIALSALNTGNNLLILVLSFLLASLIASGLVSSLVLHGLKISLNAPRAVHARQKAVFFLSLKNLKRIFPSFALTLKGGSGWDPSEENRKGILIQERSFPCVRAGEELKLDLQVEFRRRGVYSVDSFEVRTAFPFGFFSKGRELKAHGSIVVYPELRELELLLRAHPYLLGTQEKPRKGSGTGLYNIRPYQGGDSTRSVHWKSTAKLSQLMVKDFVAEEETPLNLAFSACLPDPQPEQLRGFELAVSYLASLGRHYRAGGHAFSFQSGEFSIRVNGGNEEYEAFMEYLACVEPSSNERLNLADLVDSSILFAPGRGQAPAGVLLINYLDLWKP